jgi:phenylacetate-CoA ligase
VTLARRLAWDAVLAATSTTPRELRRLIRWERLDAAAATAVQRARLTRLARHAHAHVPWYRTALEQAGVVSPAGEVALEHWTNLPILTKDVLRAEADRLQAIDGHPRATYWNTSGGSTGEPVRLLQDQRFRDVVRAVAILFNRWVGYRFGDPLIKIWGSERDLFEGGESRRTRIVRWLRNEHWFNAFRMSPAQMRECLDEIDRLRPVLVLGYVESLVDLARVILQEGRSVHQPRAVMSAAGPLDADARTLIAQAFRAPVFDRYGSREVGDVACECDRHGGLHVCVPTHLVEILRPDGQPAAPREWGELVITVLMNYSMPLLRFRIGDVSAWRGEPCSCGRAWPLLERVTGRVSDMFVRADGTHVHGEYFTHLFYSLPWVRKFQVVQETLELIQVHILPIDNAGDPAVGFQTDLDDVRRKIRLVMGDGCAVGFSFPLSIEPAASGKFRYTISKVAHA